MTRNMRTKGRRLAARLLLLTVTAVSLAAAPKGAGQITARAEESQTAVRENPLCDETLYVTLDADGEIQESSVVKRYAVREDGEIVDYGDYQKVSNLTTKAEAKIGEDGSVSFPVQAADGAFYFEGQTQTGWEDLPWTIKVRYLLNGVETPLEKLAGASGLIEIQTDLIPNRQASDYYRNNMALTMTTMVDQDQVLSVRAEGAQLQTVGNMSAIVYFALPGEECHYTIAIGSEDFTFSGLIFMMVPLTLSQLDEVADLRDAKDTLEDSIDSVDESLDVILDTMDQMRSGIASTAEGLRGLDGARETFHGKKDQVYGEANRAMEELDRLSETLKPFGEHTDAAQNALEDMRASLNNLMDDVDELGPKLCDVKDTVRDLRDDLNNIRISLSGPEAGQAEKSLAQLLEKTKGDLQAVKQSQQDLTAAARQMAAGMAAMRSGQEALALQTSLLAGLDLDTDYDPEEIEELLEYLDAEIPLIDDRGVETEASLSAASPSDWTVSGSSRDGGAAAAGLLDNPQIAAGLGAVLQAGAGLAGNTGVTDDLTGMISLAEGVLALLESQKKNFGYAAYNTQDLLTNIGKLCDVAEDVLADLDDVDQTLNKYHDEAKGTLADLGAMTDQAAVGITSLNGFFRSLKDQLESAGGALNEGTRQTLLGLADVLDHAGDGLSRTGVIRGAKDTIHDTIEDEWDQFSEEHTTILDIDLEAEPVSFTSARNPSPRSIQIILRTHEITEEDKAEAGDVDESFHPQGTVLQRIGAIFLKIWQTVLALFS